MLKEKNLTLPKQSDDDWSAHIKALSESGLSCKAYCQKHDLNYNQLFYRVQKLKAKKKKAQATLIPVSVQASMKAKAALCRVDLKGGHSILIYESEALHTVLGGLL